MLFMSSSICSSTGWLSSSGASSSAGEHPSNNPIVISNITIFANTSLTSFHIVYKNSLKRGERCVRSEEHTSELQSRGHLVCRLLLEKKTEEGRRRGVAGS